MGRYAAPIVMHAAIMYAVLPVKFVLMENVVILHNQLLHLLPLQQLQQEMQDLWVMCNHHLCQIDTVLMIMYVYNIT